MSELDRTNRLNMRQVADRYHRIEHEFQTRDGYAIEAQGRNGADRSWLPQGRLDAPDR